MKSSHSEAYCMTVLTALMGQVSAQSINRASYPPALDPAPGFPLWTKALLKGASIPALPLRTPYSPSDYSGDVATCPRANAWALTLDDGPGPYTDANALDPLQTYDIKATFFVTGQQAIQYPDLIRKMYNQGHEIAIHTWSHTQLTTISNDQVVAEVVWTAKLIKELINVTPKFVRPPAGDIDPRVRAILRAMGFQVIMWNRDSYDWCYNNSPPSAPCSPTSNSSSIPSLFSSWILQGGGAISLQHDLFLVTSQQIAPVLQVMRNSSYTMQTVSECLSTSAYDERIWDRIQKEAEESNVSPDPPKPNPSPSDTSKKPVSRVTVSSTQRTKSTLASLGFQGVVAILPIVLILGLFV